MRTAADLVPDFAFERRRAGLCENPDLVIEPRVGERVFACAKSAITVGFGHGPRDVEHGAFRHLWQVCRRVKPEGASVTSARRVGKQVAL